MLRSKINEIKREYVFHNADMFARNDGSIDLNKVNQISYDKTQELIATNEIEIVDAIYENITSIVGKSINRNINVHIVSVPDKYVGNLDKALEMQVWGFTETNGGKNEEKKIDDLRRIKENDILVFVQGWKSSLPNRKAGRPCFEQYPGTYNRVIGVVVTKEMYISDTKIWDGDKIYPYRIGIDNRILFESKDIPCTIENLGPYTFNTIRNLNSFSTSRQIGMNVLMKFLY